MHCGIQANIGHGVAVQVEVRDSHLLVRFNSSWLGSSPALYFMALNLYWVANVVNSASASLMRLSSISCVALIAVPFHIRFDCKNFMARGAAGVLSLLSQQSVASYSCSFLALYMHEHGK